MQTLSNAQVLLSFFDALARLFLVSLYQTAKYLTSLDACDDALQVDPFSEYQQQRSVQPIFYPNRNYNVAVAELPLKRMKFKIALSMMMPIEHLIRVKRPEYSNGVKDEYFNEKSNHYSRFGKANPDRIAGKRRTCPTFYRV
ncbi:hypothetical protein [Fodinibius roseus]|uniref:hypothetical protein n=1 Tax=Fodinibius roseus TaxID=1194090 RepID=UPI00147DE95E|nr:hypothetical protein [Fodinibius roseus]